MRSITASVAIATVVGALLAGGATGVSAANTAYPTRPVEVIVPFPAGGATDVIARLVCNVVSKELGQAFLIINKSGGTGSIGASFVARAKPDGYTLLIATASTHAVLPAFRSDLPYNNLKDFAPVTLLATFPNILVVNPSKVPANTVSELIEYLKKRPGVANFGSSGTGSSIHLSGEMFKLMTKTKMVHIPYKGSAPALTDLLAGNIDMMFDNMTAIWPLVQQGKLKALGVASLNRTPLAPNVPAISETLPGFQANSWVGVAAPAGTPSEIVDKLSKAFGAAMKDPAIIKKLNQLGATPDTTSPAGFAEFIKNDNERWIIVVRDGNLAKK